MTSACRGNPLVVHEWEKPLPPPPKTVATPKWSPSDSVAVEPPPAPMTDEQRYQCALNYVRRHVETGTSRARDYALAWKLVHSPDFDIHKLSPAEKAAMDRAGELLKMDSLQEMPDGRARNYATDDAPKLRAGDILVYHKSADGLDGEPEDGAEAVVQAYEVATSKVNMTIYNENEQAETHRPAWMLSLDPVGSPRRLARPLILWFRPQYATCVKLLKQTSSTIVASAPAPSASASASVGLAPASTSSASASNGSAPAPGGSAAKTNDAKTPTAK